MRQTEISTINEIGLQTPQKSRPKKRIPNQTIKSLRSISGIGRR